MPGQLMRIQLVQDSREQSPLCFSRWPEVSTRVGTLQTGDYSLQGLEDRFCIERKSIPDLVASLTSGRERFTRELQRMRGHELAVIVVEANMAQIAKHDYRSKASPESILQSLAAFHVRYGVPVLWCGSPSGAAYQVRSLARHYLLEAQKTYRAVLSHVAVEAADRVLTANAGH